MTDRRNYLLEYNLIIHHIRENKKRQNCVTANIVEAEKKRRFAIKQYKLITEENQALEQRLHKLKQRYKKIRPMKVRFGDVEERIYYVDKKMRKYHTKKRADRKRDRKRRK